MKETAPIIVADVGGTNGRFGIARFSHDGVELEHTMKYSNEGLAGFSDLLALYLEELGDAAPRAACFATAGPSDGRRGLLTNLDWTLDAAALERQFGLDEVLFVNDFKALARMAPELPEDGSIPVKTGEKAASAPISVIGPGTGLGVALVLPEAGGPVTIGTEGGHMSFAPGNDLEVALRNHLAREHNHVYAELLLSGKGLCRIHDFLVAERGDGNAGLSAAEITDAALAGDESCLASVQLFLSILGSIAGDVALCHGALGGVFLGGGIVRRVVPLLEHSGFCERFVGKGRMRDYMDAIPVRLITAERVARRGAARLFQQHRTPPSR
jgi:glucokinase